MTKPMTKGNPRVKKPKKPRELRRMTAGNDKRMYSARVDDSGVGVTGQLWAELHPTHNVGIWLSVARAHELRDWLTQFIEWAESKAEEP